MPTSNPKMSVLNILHTNWSLDLLNNNIDFCGVSQNKISCLVIHYSKSEFVKIECKIKVATFHKHYLEWYILSNEHISFNVFNTILSCDIQYISWKWFLLKLYGLINVTLSISQLLFVDSSIQIFYEVTIVQFEVIFRYSHPLSIGSALNKFYFT